MDPSPEHLKWYILNHLDREPQRKHQIINSILEDRVVDRWDIIDAFRELEEEGYIEGGTGHGQDYNLTESGEIRLIFTGISVTSAIDFVGVQHKSHLDEYLLNILDLENPPEERTMGGGAISISSQEWGELDIDSHHFDSVKISTLFYNNVPFNYYVIIHGYISADRMVKFLQKQESPPEGDDNKSNTDDSSSFSFGSARGEILDIWEQKMGDFGHTIVSNHPESFETVGETTPLTVNTISIDNRLNEAIIGKKDIRNSDIIPQYYASELNRNGLFGMFDINPRAKKSIFHRAVNSLLIVGKANRFQPDNKKYHSNYTFVEVSSGFYHKPMMPPPSALQIEDEHYRKFLPLLYFYNWSKIKEREFWDINKQMRELDLDAIDVAEGMEDIQEDMRGLLNAELDFSDRYARMRYHSDISESYFEHLEEWRKEGDSGTEISMPSPQTSRPSDEEVSGLFEDVISDAETQLEDTAELYEGLNERLLASTNSMNRVLSFQSSSTNIRLNDEIRILTIVLVIIAVAQAVSGNTWVQNNWEILLVFVGLVISLLAVWYSEKEYS